MMFKQFLLSFFLLLTVCNLSAQTLKKVPTQKLPLFNMIDDYYYQATKSNITADSISSYNIEGFEISNFVTYFEYKKYLFAIKRDSSTAYYHSQLPDSNISQDVKIYLEYLNTSKYDQYPVLGISWNNAMNYCTWKNRMENISDTAEGAYRLPNTSEWISAYFYFEKQNIKHDLNNKYTDWLLSAYSESAHEFGSDAIYFGLNYVYHATENDRPVYHRKRFIGNSYLYDQENLLEISGYGYDYTGYRHVGFRIVKGKGINTFNLR